MRLAAMAVLLALSTPAYAQLPPSSSYPDPERALNDSVSSLPLWQQEDIKRQFDAQRDDYRRALEHQRNMDEWMAPFPGEGKW